MYRSFYCKTTTEILDESRDEISEEGDLSDEGDEEIVERSVDKFVADEKFEHMYVSKDQILPTVSEDLLNMWKRISRYSVDTRTHAEISGLDVSTDNDYIELEFSVTSTDDTFYNRYHHTESEMSEDLEDLFALTDNYEVHYPPESVGLRHKLSYYANRVARKYKLIQIDTTLSHILGWVARKPTGRSFILSTIGLALSLVYSSGLLSAVLFGVFGLMLLWLVSSYLTALLIKFR